MINTYHLLIISLEFTIINSLDVISLFYLYD